MLPDEQTNCNPNNRCCIAIADRSQTNEDQDKDVKSIKCLLLVRIGRDLDRGTHIGIRAKAQRCENWRKWDGENGMKKTR